MNLANRLSLSNSVKRKLIAIMLLVATIPLVVAITISYLSSSAKAKMDAQEELLTKTNFLNSEFHTIILNTQTALKSLAASPTTVNFIKTGSEADLKLVKQQMLEVNKCFDDENVIVLSNRTGMMILRSDESNLADISSREYFQKALSGSANVSSVLISKSTNSRNICIAVPVYDPATNTVIGVLHRSYDLDNFHTLLATNSEESFLIDQTGILAAHADYTISVNDEPKDFSSSPYMTSGKTSDTFISNAMEYANYVAYVKEPLSNFTICSAKSVSSVTSEATRSAMMIVIIGIVMLIMVTIISVIMANGFTKPILAVDHILSSLAEGQFLHINEFTERKDEFGDMVRNSNSVIDKLEEIVGQIKVSSQTVGDASDNLSVMANQIASTTETVAEAVQQIAAGASEQALSVQHSAENSGQITDAVENVQFSTNDLNSLALRMKDASEKSSNALTSFRMTSTAMADKILEITNKISATQDAVSDINDRVEGISGIAAQTNLLSLNASIEAARAGDAGRGFSVVAEEIRKLADDSESLAQEIMKVMTTLLNESSEAVHAANEIIESNHAQQASLEDTLSAVQGMLSDIEETVVSVEKITDETSKCVASNKEVSDAMAALSAISEENAASSETTGASVEELSATVTQLAESANELKSVSDVLIRNISFFK